MSTSTIEPDYDYLFKVMVVGPTATGKTSLITRFADNSFPETHNLTIGLDIKVKTVQLDGRTVKLQVWDTAGQERYRSVVNMHYRGSHGCIGVFDITNKDSFVELKENIEQVQELYEVNGGRIIIIGNKSDLEDQRQVSTEEAAQFAESIGCIFMEASAKTARNVSTAFNLLAENLMEKSDYAGSQSQRTREIMLPRRRSSLMACEKIEIRNRKLSDSEISNKTKPVQGPKPQKSGGCC